MQVELIREQIEPPVKEVVLTLTIKEARMLRMMAGYNTSDNMMHWSKDFDRLYPGQEALTDNFRTLVYDIWTRLGKV